MAWYDVPYWVAYRGTAEVEADTPGEARAMVEAGNFDEHPGQERVDWEASGPARGREEKE